MLLSCSVPALGRGSLALGLAFSLVVLFAVCFLPVVRGWGWGLGRMLQWDEGWLESSSLDWGKSLGFCCPQAGFAGCPKAAGGHPLAGEVFSSCSTAPSQQSPEQQEWIRVLRASGSLLSWWG